MSGPGATPACDLRFRRSRPSAAAARNEVRSTARLLSVLPLIAIVALLAGCAPMEQQRVPDQPRTITVEVKVPVAVPCFEEKDRPIQPVPTPVDIENATVDQLAAALSADNKLNDIYMQAVERLYILCANQAGKEIK